MDRRLHLFSINIHLISISRIEFVLLTHLHQITLLMASPIFPTPSPIHICTCWRRVSIYSSNFVTVTTVAIFTRSVRFIYALQRMLFWKSEPFFPIFIMLAAASRRGSITSKNDCCNTSAKWQLTNWIRMSWLNHRITILLEGWSICNAIKFVPERTQRYWLKNLGKL